jgi:hypothetical protein
LDLELPMITRHGARRGSNPWPAAGMQCYKSTNSLFFCEDNTDNTGL